MAKIDNDALLKRLSSLAPKRLLLAYSGGLDSQVLLDCLNPIARALSLPLVAIHVNHHLQSEADQWVEHCRQQCQQRNISLRVCDVYLKQAPQSSLEAEAREARYRAMAEQMAEGDLLITAHHEDDQAETLMLQLLRGAGPKGLAAMAELSEFAPGRLWRPLLSVSRQQLQDYAVEHGLRWVEDSSNTDTGFDRNFLRHRLMPVLRQRWPSSGAVLARAARHQAEAVELMADLAAIDLAASRITYEPLSLSLSALREFSVARQKNLLRHWITEAGYPVPDHRRLEAIRDQVLNAAEDAQPLVSWQGVELRRYRQRLYLMSRVAVDEVIAPIPWTGETRYLAQAGGELEVEERLGEGLALRHFHRTAVEIRFRQGGEVCRLVGDAHHQSLKKRMQTEGIPPWQRSHMPLIYVDGVLAAIPGLGICEGFQAEVGEKGKYLRWIWRNRAQGD